MESARHVARIVRSTAIAEGAMRRPFDSLVTAEQEQPIRSFMDRWCPQWITPNGITMVRIVLVPAVVALMVTQHFGFAAGTFIVAMLLDLVDGPLARVRGKVTSLGKFLDPLADKVCVLVPLWT